MVRYRATLETEQEREAVFAYLSDYSTAREWDPGVVAAERLSAGPLAEGAEFRVETALLGRTTALTYRIVHYDPPRAVSFRAESSTVVSEDTITFEHTAAGTRITYDAGLRLQGPLRIADPVLRVALAASGDRARDGLRRRLPPARPAVMGPLVGRALDGSEYRFPADLDKRHSFLVAAFHRDQVSLVDEWLRWLLELGRARSDVAVYELPVLLPGHRRWRWLIDGGAARSLTGPAAVARGITAAAAQARTILIDTDVHEVLAHLGLAGADTIAVLGVAGSGAIQACETGAFDQTKAKRLAATLDSSPTSIVI